MSQITHDLAALAACALLIAGIAAWDPAERQSETTYITHNGG